MYLRSSIKLIIVLLLSATSVYAQDQDRRILEPPAGVRLIQEFRLHGPVLDQIRQSQPELADVRALTINRYAFGRPSRRELPPEERRELIGRVFRHYHSRLDQQGWYPLASNIRGQQDSAVYSSPGGDRLISISQDQSGFIVTVVDGVISLEQIPVLRSVILRSLGPSGWAPTQAEREYLDRARRLEDSGELAEAIRELRLGCQKEPRSPRLRKYLADLYRKAGQSSNQLEELRQALALDPMDYDIRLSYAIALFDEGRNLRQASLEFSQVAAMDPMRATPLYYLGRIAERQEDNHKALSYYERAGKLAPHWLSIPLRRASVMERMNDFQGAEKYYRQALEMKPDSSAAKQGLDRVTRTNR